MEVVINIDDNVFTRLFDNGTEDCEIVNDDLFAIAKAIRKGTPLPKGHGELKDVDVGKLPYHCMWEKNAYCDHKNCNICQFMCVAKWEMEDMPTIIEADKESEE